MPTLSPAVAGGTGVSRGSMSSASLAGPSLIGGSLRTVPTVGSTTFSGMPTAIVTSPTTTPAPATTPAPPAPASVPAVWSTLDADTQSVARGDTEKPSQTEETPGKPEKKERSSRSGKRKKTEESDSGKKVKLALIAGASVVVLMFTLAGAWLIYKFTKKVEPQPTQSGPQVNSRKITVSKIPGEGTAGTLREALNLAQPGYTIVITEPRLTEGSLQLARHKHKDLVIESATPDGKPAIIEYAGLKGGIMLDASNVEGLQLRNVEFDGKGSADTAVQIFGITPSTTFENVTVRNVVKKGFHLWSVTGSAEHPIVLDRARVVLTPTMEGGVVSFVSGALDNKFIIIRNSRFEGPPGGIGIRIDGPVMDMDINNNRFFNLTAAVLFTHQGRALKGTITNNTLYTVTVGLLFEVPAKDQTSFGFRVNQNYFSRTPELARSVGPVVSLTSENNLHDAASATIPGVPMGTSPLLNSTKIDSPTLPNPNPEDDATFLRFPLNTPLTIGPNKIRVGAQ
jgi:hypothetical protein